MPRNANLAWLGRLVRQLPLVSHVRLTITYLDHISRQLSLQHELLAEQFTQQLLTSPRYHEHNRLNSYEQQIYSQSGEDGILAEIFRRIGVSNRYFVEFGVGDGTENNTLLLLTQGWRGGWIEASSDSVRAIRSRFEAFLARQTLRLCEAFVAAENIEALLRELNVPNDPDLLSIDIDGNDYWVWKAITSYRPRVVVIEYNATFPPPMRWVRAYDAKAIWDQSSYFGASLASLEALGTEKGYQLVGCNLAGTNAFFVRNDLCDNRFEGPSSAEYHYEPPRYFLYRQRGHRRGFGPFEEV